MLNKNGNSNSDSLQIIYSDILFFLILKSIDNLNLFFYYINIKFEIKNKKTYLRVVSLKLI